MANFTPLQMVQVRVAILGAGLTQNYENDQYATQSRENESRFHYLCLIVPSFLGARTGFFGAL